ncbi:MAG: GNAT family N-acetyltransferase [Candidatus Heimdallarchaeota archaeon]
MSFSLRLATKEDIPNLVELRIEFLNEALNETPDDGLDVYREHLGNYFEKHMSDGTFLAWLAIDENDNIIATSGLSIIIKPPQLWNVTGEESYIMNMYTKPTWRRQGIGSALLEKLLEESKSRCINRVTLYATPVGRPLYEKYGFEPSSHFMRINLE